MNYSLVVDVVISLLGGCLFFSLNILRLIYVELLTYSEIMSQILEWSLISLAVSFIIFLVVSINLQGARE